MTKGIKVSFKINEPLLTLWGKIMLKNVKDIPLKWLTEHWNESMRRLNSNFKQTTTMEFRKAANKCSDTFFSFKSSSFSWIFKYVHCLWWCCVFKSPLFVSELWAHIRKTEKMCWKFFSSYFSSLWQFIKEGNHKNIHEKWIRNFDLSFFHL